MKSIFWSMLVLSRRRLCCAAQDKSTAAIKGKVSVERGSPSGVGVLCFRASKKIAHDRDRQKRRLHAVAYRAGNLPRQISETGLAVGTSMTCC
jgi:hypothetical protein